MAVESTKTLGDDSVDAAFFKLVEPHRHQLRLHCYRMLGSSHDSEDVMQETLVRAWRARDTLSDPAKLKPWLYRIATNECLDEIGKRSKTQQRLLASDAGEPSSISWPPAPAIVEPVWLEPMPSGWLIEDAADAADAADPSVKYALNESVALAFVAALQLLSPPQRATLLLRDVAGLSADEAAEALGLSVPATNSALHRARTAIETRLEGRDPSSFAGEQPVDPELLEKYVRAFVSGDFALLLSVLHDDIETTMPPSPTWVKGIAANEEFYRNMFAASFPGKTQLLHTSANGQSAFGYYRAQAPGETRLLRAINVIEVKGGKVRRIDHFMQAEVFPVFSLPDGLT